MQGLAWSLRAKASKEGPRSCSHSICVVVNYLNSINMRDMRGSVQLFTRTQENEKGKCTQQNSIHILTHQAPHDTASCPSKQWRSRLRIVLLDGVQQHLALFGVLDGAQCQRRHLQTHLVIHWLTLHGRDGTSQLSSAPGQLSPPAKRTLAFSRNMYCLKLASWNTAFHCA